MVLQTKRAGGQQPRTGEATCRPMAAPVRMNPNTPPHAPRPSVCRPGMEKVVQRTTIEADLLTGTYSDITSHIYSLMDNQSLVALTEASTKTQAFADRELDHRGVTPVIALDEEFRSVMTDYPLGTPMKGLGRPEGTHVVSQPRDRSSDRTLQFLTQLSVLIFSIAKKKVNTEQEVQCMEFKGKLVVTANETNSVKALSKLLSDFKSDKFIMTLLKKMPNNNIDLPDMLNRKAAKLYGVMTPDNEREEFISKELLALVGSKIEETVKLVKDIDECATEIKKTGPMILLLTPGDYHAEQNFALMLAKHFIGSGEMATIAGKKRPCASCLVTLNLLKDFWGMSLGFVPRGGNYFTPANPGLEALIALGIRQGRVTRRELNRWLTPTIAAQTTHTSKRKANPQTEEPEKGNKKAKTTTEYSEMGDSGFGTESDSDADSDDKLNLRPFKTTKKRKK